MFKYNWLLCKEPSQHSESVCAYLPAALGQIPKHNIYAFLFIFELRWENDKNKQEEVWIDPFKKLAFVYKVAYIVWTEKNVRFIGEDPNNLTLTESERKKKKERLPLLSMVRIRCDEMTQLQSRLKGKPL